MKAEIITIGDEILIGQTVDTNSAWIASELNIIGVDVLRITSISDKKDEIFKAIDNAKHLADIILLTGGLGPTDDDITKKTLVEYFKTELIQNKEVLNNIEQFVIRRKSSMNERNVQQANVPKNCKIINNSIGTAPGMWFEQEGRIVISMPGVPFEMKEMMSSYILPVLAKKSTNSSIVHKTILTQGCSESKLAEILENWEYNLPDVISVAYLPTPGLIKLRLTAKGKTQNLLEKLIDEQIVTLEKVIPKLICGYDSDKLEELIGRLLIKHNKTLSVAESCTGGKIAHLITSISGSSAYFAGGIIAYSNSIKENILSVSKSNLDNYGAVSKQVVEGMAEGVRKLYETDFAIATSGIAGPTGGTEDKPIGTTWIAVSNKSKVVSKKFIFGNHRGRNINFASLTAINMLRKLILEK
ncbi:MAG: competence/damage-inducible protein A [Bacteroidales bacterium]|jgi:nicotinamide-nucleotide amidase|nr:competence/damage-inducible protein A [Bacteroidales bacterium]